MSIYQKINMSFKKQFWFFFALSAWMILAIPLESIAQESIDFTQIKVDELSDDEIENLLVRASDAGLSTQEFLDVAQSRGMPPQEVAKLKIRIEELNISFDEFRRNTKVSVRPPRSQFDLSSISKGGIGSGGSFMLNEADSEIFGSSIFYGPNRKLNFEPSLNQATPKSYILGPGDVIYVDIYGESEQYYEATINPDGFILLENIGPINVSGKTIEEATGIIKSRVSRYYTSLSGRNPTTFLQLTLGNVRTIKVNILGEVRLPGTFTLSAFSTVFNALYAAGGPNSKGTMRKIKLLRNNSLIAEIDVYELLLNGQAKLNLQLQDQDVI